MLIMQLVRSRAAWFAAVAITWHVVTIATVSIVLSCDRGPALEHAGMEDCPMQHSNEPACPLHAEKHGTHDCDCPTLACAQTNAGFMALFGTVGILPAIVETSVPFDITDGTLATVVFPDPWTIVPPAPPPRT